LVNWYILQEETEIHAWFICGNDKALRRRGKRVVKIRNMLEERM